MCVFPAFASNLDIGEHAFWQGSEGSSVALSVRRSSGEVVALTGTRIRCGDAHANADDDNMSVVSAAPSTMTQRVRTPLRLEACQPSTPFLHLCIKPNQASIACLFVATKTSVSLCVQHIHTHK
jgi:hypothetical protein